MKPKRVSDASILIEGYSAAIDAIALTTFADSLFEEIPNAADENEAFGLALLAASTTSSWARWCRAPRSSSSRSPTRISTTPSRSRQSAGVDREGTAGDQLDALTNYLGGFTESRVLAYPGGFQKAGFSK